MKIMSEPSFTEETVTDLDFAFLNGMRSITLRATDTIADHLTHIVMNLSNPQETFVVYRAHLLWYSSRTRTIRTPVAITHPSTAV